MTDIALHPFRVFRLRVDMCADCGMPRARHQMPGEPESPWTKTKCHCTPPLLYWGDCSLHGAPWKTKTQQGETRE